MPTLKPSRFSAYEFTEQEFKSAAVFNPLQKMHIQTKQCEIAESLLNLDCAEKKDLDNFEVQRAFLKGQLTMLEHLLEISESMELNIREEQAETGSHNFVVNRPPENGNIFGSDYSDPNQPPANLGE